MAAAGCHSCYATIMHALHCGLAAPAATGIPAAAPTSPPLAVAAAGAADANFSFISCATHASQSGVGMSHSADSLHSASQLAVRQGAQVQAAVLYDASSSCGPELLVCPELCSWSRSVTHQMTSSQYVTRTQPSAKVHCQLTVGVCAGEPHVFYMRTQVLQAHMDDCMYTVLCMYTLILVVNGTIAL